MDRIQLRRDSLAQWAKVNPVLLEGEIGLVLDDPNKYKVGDGINAWNDLPLRGFNGNVANAVGDSEDTVISQKFATTLASTFNVSMSLPEREHKYYSSVWRRISRDASAGEYSAPATYQIGDKCNMPDDETYSYEALEVVTGVPPYTKATDNKYNLSEAIAALPASLRRLGMHICFINYDNEYEIWESVNTSFTSTSGWQQTDGKHFNKKFSELATKETSLLTNVIFDKVGVPFILDAYMPNIPSDVDRIGVCSVVQDLEKNEFRINFYKVNEDGSYVTAIAVDTIFISDLASHTNGLVVATSNSLKNTFVIDLFRLNKEIAKDGINLFRSVFSDTAKIEHFGFLQMYKNANDILENSKRLEINSQGIKELSNKIFTNLSTGRKEDSYTNVYDWSHYYNVFESGTYIGIKVKIRDISEDVHIAKIDVNTKELTDIKVLSSSDYVKNDWNIIYFDEPVTLKSNEQICVYSTVACVYVSFGDEGIIEGKSPVGCGYYKINDSSWGTMIGSSWNHAIIPLEYKFVLNTDFNELKETLANSEYEGDFITPHSIYLTQDGFNIKNTMPHRLYIDHLVNMSKYSNIYFDKTRADIYHLSADVNKAITGNKTELPLDISIANVKAKKSFNIVRRITKTNVGENTFVKLMQLGDSVGGGFGGNSNIVDNNPGVSWAVTQKLFMLDGIKSGDYDNKYKMQTLGFRNSVAVEATYNSTTKTSTAYGEGRGGWRLTDYLYRKFQGETGVEQEPTEGSVLNPFYDENKVWIDSELNEKGVKFSLKKYLERFRNYTDDGVKIEQGGEGIGTNITFDGVSNTSQLIVRDTEAFVCTPTHFISQLGFNDVETPSENDADYPDFIENTRLLIKAIREEFPSIIIGISMIDSAGGYFPQYYREYSNEGFFNMLGNALHRKVFNWIEQIYQLCSESDNVYFIPNYFIQPTIKGCQWLDLVGADGEVSKYVGTNGNYHPNNIAHSAWGQQIYNWIKWTLVE